MTKSIMRFRAEMEAAFISRLFILSELDEAGELKMQLNNKQLGFAKNDNYSPLKVCNGVSFSDFKAIGHDNIIVYVNGSNAGFALLGPDRETCLETTVRELTDTWVDESPQFQRSMLNGINKILDDILAESGLVQ